jgi:hypothetical protein
MEASVDFEIKDCPAVLHKGEWGATTQQPRGDSGSPKKVSETTLHIRLDVTDTVESLNWMLPGIEEMVAATKDSGVAGFDVVPRTKVPDLTLSIAVKGSVVFSQSHCVVKQKVHVGMKHTEKSDEVFLVIRPRAKLTTDETKMLQELSGADIMVSFAPTQKDITENAPLISAPPKMRKLRALKDAPESVPGVASIAVAPKSMAAAN